jgi:hypothetical protein
MSADERPLNLTRGVCILKKNFKLLVVLLALSIAFTACGGGGGGSSSAVSAAQYKTFVTTATFDGDIKTAGGQSTAIASADHLCMVDTNKPTGGSVYKALLVDGANRVACATTICSGGASEHIDWVLKPNAIYTRKDGTTPVFTTNANGIYDFGVGGTIPAINTFDTGASLYWTGLDWPWVSVTSQMCGGSWSGTTGNGDYGFGNRTDSSAIGGGANSCNVTNYRLLCIEQ